MKYVKGGRGCGLENNFQLAKQPRLKSWLRLVLIAGLLF